MSKACNTLFGTVVVLLTASLCANTAAADFGWRSTGMYRIKHNEYRHGLFDPDGGTVDMMGLERGAIYSLNQAIQLELEIVSLSMHLDALATGLYSDAWDDDIEITQLYVQHDLLDGWHVTAGRIILRWGTGYSFNPTDVLAPEKELADPDNEEHRMKGRDLVKVEYFGGSYSAAAVLSGKVTPGEPRIDDLRAAFRLYKNVLDTDISLIASIAEKETPLWGANVSTVIGDRLELHGESIFQKGSYQGSHRALSGENELFNEFPFNESQRGSAGFYNRYLLGLQYTLPGNVTWTLEYYHQDHGYSKAEWERLISYSGYLDEQLAGVSAPLARTNMLWSMNVFSPKGSMRDYLMSYMGITIRQRHTVEMTLLLNLADGSCIVLPEVHIGAGNHLTFYARGSILEGGIGTEFGEVFLAGYFEGGVRIRL